MEKNITLIAGHCFYTIEGIFVEGSLTIEDDNGCEWELTLRPSITDGKLEYTQYCSDTMDFSCTKEEAENGTKLIMSTFEGKNFLVYLDPSRKREMLWSYSFDIDET